MLRGRDTGRGGVLVRQGVFAVLLILTIPRLSAQPVELASRVHPSQISDTGVGSERIDNGPYSINYTLTTPSLSADGRYIAFLSQQINLVAGQTDANGRLDVFLRDLVTGATTLVSRSMSSPATTGNLGSVQAVISADGRFVAFTSRATDLVPGQTGDGPSQSDQDLLLYDRVTGAISLVASSQSRPAFFTNLALSADGRYLAFSSNAGDLVPGQRSDNSNVFLHDRVEKKTRLVSHVSTSATSAGNGGSGGPSISADGRYIAFTSRADNLVPGQGGSLANAFLFDRVSGALTLIGPGETATSSADGKYVAVLASNEIYLYQRETRQTTSLGQPRLRDYYSTDRPIVSISADGRYTAFIGAPGASPNGLYVYDRVARTFTLASRRSGSAAEPGGAPDAPVISGDGRFVVFASPDPDLVANQTDASGDSRTMDVFLFDRASATTRLVSHASDAPTLAANGVSHAPAISANGERVAFASMANNLAGDVKDHNEGLDVFVQATASGETEAVSHRAPEMPSLSPDATSTARALSADGRFLAFESDSPYLVPGQVDPNGTTDVFLYDRQTKTTVLVSRLGGSATQTGKGPAILPVITPDGRYVGFASETSDSFNGGNGYDWDLFLFDRITGTVTLVAPLAFSSRPSSLPMQISSDGRWVAFSTLADLIAPGVRDQNRNDDIYLLDRSTGSMTLVSHSSADPAAPGDQGASSPLLSGDGRTVAFLSGSTNLVPGQIDAFSTPDLFLYDRETGKTVLVSRAADSPVTAAQLRGVSFSMSADGRFLTFGRPENTPKPSVLLYDRDLGTLLTIAAGGLSPRISADGRYVTYVSVLNQDIPSQIHLYDRIASSTVLVSRSNASSNVHGTGYSDTPAISADGRYVAFASRATNLVAGQTSVPGRVGLDIFLFDRVTGRTVLVSHAADSPLAARGGSAAPLVSASGRQVAFTSTANLVAEDLNDLPDAYLFDANSVSGSGPTSLPPCTLLDTRRRSNRPVLTSNVQRTVAVRGTCGVPATAKQVVVKVTVFNPSGKGNLRFYPGAVTATPSDIFRFERNATRTETFTLPLSTNGTLTILPFVAGKGTVHVAVEVNGYSQ
jgi:Tol biopolymer transport system component